MNSKTNQINLRPIPDEPILNQRPFLKNFSINYIISLIMRYRLGVIMIFILALFWVAIELAIPFATKAIIDIGIQNQDLSMVTVILIALFALFIGRVAAEVVPLWILRHIGVRVNLMLLVGYWERIIRKSYLFFNNKEQSEIIQHFNDNSSVEAFITTYSFSFYHSLLNLGLYAIVLFIFDIRIGIVFVIFTSLFFIWSFYVLSQRKYVDQHRFEASSNIRGEINEIFRGIVDIKSNNQEIPRINLFESFHYHLSKHRLNLLRYSLYQQVGNQLLHNCRDILILYFAANAVIAGTMTLGSLIAIQYLLGQLYELTMKILDIFPKFQDAQLSINRVNESLSRYEPIESEIDKGSIDIHQKAIEIRDLSFEYVKDQPILHNISFDMEYGKSVAILGESGSGKSTLMKNVLKLLTPLSGSVRVGEYDLDHLSDKFWLTQCSTVLQESILFSRSILYNITFEDDIRNVDISRVWECLQLTLADEFVNDKPHKLDTQIGSDGVNFSKGQVQRLLLARALYKDVSYYFFDEPFSALDRLTFRRVFKNVREYLKEKTLIIVTHRREVAQLMDEIYLLEDGHLVEQGNHETLSQLGDRYFHIFISESE